MRGKGALMAVYRDRYILEGLDEIPPEMKRDLDLAYDVCQRMHETNECEMCGNCCHQPTITVRSEEVENISAALGTDPISFIEDYLDRDETNEQWVFKRTDPCVFLCKDNRCRIWKDRPEICREFPYLVSMFMSRVYLAIVGPTGDIDLSYMDDTWPCTAKIKRNVTPLIEEARAKRASLL
jgi:hypothetical protein